MTFEERKRIASQQVLAFLDGFTPPRGMTDKQLAKRIADTAEAFARRLPVGMSFAEKVGAVLTRLRDTHKSNSWPPQAAFVAEMPEQTTKARAKPQTCQIEDYPSH